MVDTCQAATLFSQVRFTVRNASCNINMGHGNLYQATRLRQDVAHISSSVCKCYTIVTIPDIFNICSFNHLVFWRLVVA